MLHACRISLGIIVTLLLVQSSIGQKGNANFSSLCEDVRKEMILRDPSLENNTNLECRSSYELEKPPALSISISVSECLERCPGYEASKHNVLNQWIGPLVGFLLPALAFVISIPRPIRLPRHERWFAARKLVAYSWLVLAMGLMLLDILFWIIAVFAFAGPLVAGSIHEAFVDHMVLGYAEKNISSDPSTALLAISFTLVGSLQPHEGDLSGNIYAYILDSPFGKQKLRSLLALLPSYGARVGVPIVFYLGAYAYALFDAKSKLGDNDTAHAVAFGLWYGVVVIVAIVSSAVLGIDNPASLEAILSENIELEPFLASENSEALKSPSRSSEPKSYHFHSSIFRTVWLWERARVFQEWSRKNSVDASVSAYIKASTPRVISGLLASVLIALPCAGACWISYSTPMVGFGCRSTVHLIYATSQIILILVWWLYYSSPTRILAKQKGKNCTESAIAVYALAAMALAAAIISSIGGTIMQLVGVFKNCICKASLKYLLPGSRAGGMVSLANDMQEHRDNARWWIIVGSIGVAFVGLVAVASWAYQTRVRQRCLALINRL
ncbi:hypothetical protein BU24DRAFT_491426 [Aaosphaeria arxii CBS 175.79]|uniref:MFS general substrate transporter n=1 Tax=Aaosphaeria arxii CBS 175.79 TaxID=1450172 RepID=A0A6A5Y070_9PLEO|nr:uncharacterized protein BU24DRAFT_491426 [Aaosphaeria arxii CBS 175.79]KAF2018467.1 hypothetical protein BU24DRAFT_491426 [Aaosphaeria arxii CBS 175.79]